MMIWLNNHRILNTALTLAINFRLQVHRLTAPISEPRIRPQVLLAMKTMQISLGYEDLTPEDSGRLSL